MKEKALASIEKGKSWLQSKAQRLLVTLQSCAVNNSIALVV
jgi:hypothetical protein